MDVVHRCYEYLVLMEGIVDNLSPLIGSLRELVETMQSTFEAETVCRRGRPRIEVHSDQLAYLVENGFRL